MTDFLVERQQQHAVAPGVRCAKSTIWYFYEQGRADGGRIFLGEIGELVLPNFGVLCMLARAELHKEEMERIGELGRRLIHRPFAYLRGEVTKIWSEHPGNTVEMLSREFSRSLNVPTPMAVEVPQ